MTREEIINGLKMSMELTLFDPSTGEVMEPRQLNDINRTAYEAYKGAIELLEKQPDTTTHDSIPAETGKNNGDRTSDDCISRQQAINEIHEDAEWLAAQGSDWQTERMERDKSILKSLPPVQPERPTGEWIHQTKFGRIECDQCGKVFRNSFTPKNFCPNCGADMRNVKDESKNQVSR